MHIVFTSYETSLVMLEHLNIFLSASVGDVLDHNQPGGQAKTVSNFLCLAFV